MFKRVILSLMALGLVFAIQPVMAQMEGEGLTISPPVTELNLVPGNSYAKTIKITNPTENLVEVYPIAMNFKAKDETGTPGFSSAEDEEANFSMAHWISFDQSKLALTPEQVVEFNYTIEVPAEAEAGGHYGALFFASEPPELEGDTSQVAIASQIGALVLGRVDGEIIEQGSVEEFSVAKKFYFTPLIDLIARIKDSGNVHFKPKGDIGIKNLFGQEVGSVAVNESEGNVLPDSIRKFEQQWAPDISAFYKIPIGRFTANLALTYGENENALAATTTFWILPIWFIVVVGIVIIGIIFLIIRGTRKRKSEGGSAPVSEPEIVEDE